MTDLNRVVIIGRLTRDAELKSIASGLSICKFSIAVNRRRKNGDQWEDEVSYFDVVLWGKQGENIHQYLLKGKMVGVDGELRQDRWNQDGQNRSKVEIVANNVQLLGGNSGGGGNSGYNNQNNGGYSAPAAQGSPAPGSSAPGSSPQADDNFADDIPF